MRREREKERERDRLFRRLPTEILVVFQAARKTPYLMKEEFFLFLALLCELISAFRPHDSFTPYNSAHISPLSLSLLSLSLSSSPSLAAEVKRVSERGRERERERETPPHTFFLPLLCKASPCVSPSPCHSPSLSLPLSLLSLSLSPPPLSVWTPEGASQSPVRPASSNRQEREGAKSILDLQEQRSLGAKDRRNYSAIKIRSEKGRRVQC